MNVRAWTQYISVQISGQESRSKGSLRWQASSIPLCSKWRNVSGQRKPWVLTTNISPTSDAILMVQHTPPHQRRPRPALSVGTGELPHLSAVSQQVRWAKEKRTLVSHSFPFEPTRRIFQGNLSLEEAHFHFSESDSRSSGGCPSHRQILKSPSHSITFLKAH